MIISGVVIDVAPGAGLQAAAALLKRPGVTKVESTVSRGRIVAVVEAGDTAALDSLVESILSTPGILGVNPAFIHFDA